MTSANVLQELEWRGFVQQATPGLAAHFAKGPVTAYCGFDPTAPSLQLGNLMPLMLLANLQRAGNRPIVLMGGGTGLIGDPSGKAGERPLLSKEQIRENLQRQRDQMARFLEFGAGPTAALLLDNARWLGDQKLIDFLRDVGKHFTVNVMLQKESVKARLESGLSFTEFSYMLLQAYDFLHLFRERQCTLQVGGSDQWGNITAGCELIRRVANAEVHALVAPLVTMASGQKFGKTETGAIYLDPQLTSPYKFYQFWINVDDRDVEKYLKLFTLQTRSEIEELAAQQQRGPAGRPAQRALAADVTTRVHGADVLQGVVRASAILFGEEESRSADARVFDILAQEIPTATAEGADTTIVDAVIQAGLAKSKNEARRAIEQGGIYLNQQRIDDAARTLGPGDWIAGRNALLRKGKKEYALLRKQR
ncbi:MAG: tyrosine--tRNA ligase [Gemmatimonadetes bacterium 13_2_20CM_2_65_7]|nr:MAG: tyrosine--tRNA ligase [Gemmatimonadetes bacterium 13_2_20CM_2_65_7]